jgi:hypothetical protein
MFVAVGVTICLVFFKISPIPRLFISLGTYGQSFCVRATPSSVFHELYSAIVCGESVRQQEYLHLFRGSGLIHILVVSGAHLIWLDALFARARLKPLLRVPLFFVYTLFSGFGAPIVRSFLQIVFSMGFPAFNLSLRIAASGLLTWTLRPVGEQALSLQLSWCCALILCAARLLLSRSWLLSCAVIYVGLLPLLLTFTMPHPFSILMNWAFSATIGIALFPASLFCFVCPVVTPIVDVLWKGVLQTLHLFSPYMESDFVASYTAPVLLWGYVILIQSLVWLLEIHCQRQLWLRPSSSS